MAVYNTSWMENVTNPVDIMTNVGTLIGNQYTVGYFILFAFFLIFLILTMRYDMNEVIVVDGFLTTLLAILLYGAGLVPGFVIVFPAIVLFISLIFLFVSKK